MWGNVLTWLTTTTSKLPITDCALALLATIAHKRLTPTPLLRSDKFWSLPSLQQHPTTQAVTTLIYAAFCGGECSSKALQEPAKLNLCANKILLMP